MFEDRQKRAGENREEITKRPHLGTQRAKSTAWRRLFDTRLRVSSEPAAVRRVLRTAAAATILKEEEWRVLLLPRLAYPPPPPRHRRRQVDVRRRSSAHSPPRPAEHQTITRRARRLIIRIRPATWENYLQQQQRTTSQVEEKKNELLKICYPRWNNPAVKCPTRRTRSYCSGCFHNTTTTILSLRRMVIAKDGAISWNGVQRAMFCIQGRS